MAIPDFLGCYYYKTSITKPSAHHIVISYWNVSRLTLLYVQSEAAAGRGGVVSPAYSVDSTVTVSTVSSSTATEKSVRFSDRDHILSTPGEC